MRRIKKRNLNTIRIKRDAYVKNVKDEEEVIVEEVVDITPERVTMEEKTEPVCADVAADVENSVEEAETEAEAAEKKAEAEVAEETVAEETEEVEPVEEVAEEVEATEEAAPVEEPAAEEVAEPVAEVAEETAEPDEEITEEKVVEDTVTITPDEVVFDEEEKPADKSEETDVEEAVLESEAGEPAEETVEEKVVEDTVTITPDEVVFDEEEKPADKSEETDVEEAVLAAEAEETETAEATEEVEEATEEAEEVPLEASEEESEEILDEEGSLDGTEEEARALAEEVEAEEPATEDEAAEEVEAEEAEEAVETEAKEEKPAEKTEKEAFKLTTPANQDDILSKICVKRGRKLIYRPNEIIFNCTAAVTGTDKNNEEGIKIKNILDEEIKQGVKLGYIDKYDGLKMSEIKEEYENDVVYEYAEQEFKRVGLVLEGEKVKVYVYDWDMKALHHIGFVDQANVADLKPYLENRDKYSFDVCGLITGGKFRKVVKDEATGKITVEKGNDGKLGVELDISIINRKD